MLTDNDEFRAQFNSLLDDEAINIDIEAEMSYTSSVSFYACLCITLTIIQSPGNVNIRIVDIDLLFWILGQKGMFLVIPRYKILTGIQPTPAIVGNNGNNREMMIAIPNREIRSTYHEWLRVHITQYITKHGLETPIRNLFCDMMSGSISSFAKAFGALVLEEMPGQFLGSKEVVYQSWVHGYISAAAAGMGASRPWEVDVERYAGAGRLDLIIKRPGGTDASIQEYKRIALTEKDKKTGYTESKCNRLAKHAKDALKQVEDRSYRLSLKKHVTNLHEYGIAFLGPYCAVVGRSLKRECAGQWVIVKEYSDSEDRVRREELYTVASQAVVVV